MTSKVVLSNVQVLTAGTRMETTGDQSKPVQVTVVTLLVYPEQAERLALASTEGKIQLALRNPLDQGAPATPGIKTSGLMGAAPASVRQTAGGSSRPRAAQPVTQTVPAAEKLPTVEMIRGDKRATEELR
jgi:pilus assembly protein CpaB